jgi:hypothetical protein
VVDQILAALGWPNEEIGREMSSGAGDFLDYELRAAGLPWMVVEAKRIGETFLLAGLAPSVEGLVRSLRALLNRGGAHLREIMKQAAGYCNDRGVPLACVTNGRQWILFRGLSSRGRPWTQGSAVVFDGPAEIEAHFDDFWDCLARATTHRAFLFEALDHPPSRELPSARVPRDHISRRIPDRDGSTTSLTRSISTFFFSEIHGSEREPLLERCYVEPGMANEFERSIQRLLKDSERTLDDGPNPVLGGGTQNFIGQLAHQSAVHVGGSPVVLVGHVGVGKTTFLHRCMSHFRSNQDAFCSIVDLEGRGQGGSIDGQTEERWVAGEVLTKLGHAAGTVVGHRDDLPTGERLQAEPDSPEALRTMLRDRLDKEHRLGERIWAEDKRRWAEKEYEIFAEFRSDPVSHLVRYTRHLSSRFKRPDGARYPVLIAIDNVDLGTDEYQKCIYGLAHRLAHDTRAVVVVCLREDTYLSAREPGGFLTSSSLPFVFHVAAPSVSHLIRSRADYAEYACDQGLLPAGLRAVAQRVTAVAALVETVFLTPKSETLAMVASLSGQNMRQALELVRGLIEGHVGVSENPSPSAAYAFECLLLAIGDAELRAKYRVANCFDADPWNPPLHALKARLLAYYSYAFDTHADRVRLEDTEAVLACFAAWGYPLAALRPVLRSLLVDGLLRPIDPSSSPEAEYVIPPRMTLSPAGYAHVHHLLRLKPYRAAMSLMTRWYDSTATENFIQAASLAGGEVGPTVGDIVESRALDFFNAYLARSVALENAILAQAAEKQPWVGEVLSRSGGLLQDTAAIPQPSELSPDFRGAKATIPEGGQTTFDFPALVDGNPSGPSLPRIRPDTEYAGTVWLPRLLWALEWANRAGLGPRSASEIAAILREHGDVDVPGTNVARAFREFRENRGGEGLWEGAGKRYSILPGGRSLLAALIKEN